MQQQAESKNEAFTSPVIAVVLSSILPAEVIKEDILVLDTQILQQFDHCGVHHWRPAHIELTVFWRFVVLQVLLVQDIVDKAGKAFPVIFWLWIRECQMPVKVVVLSGQASYSSS